MLTPIKKQGDEHIYILPQIAVINWISVRYVDILSLVWMLIGSEIVSLNYAASGKSPLCSGASQFAAGYAAAQPRALSLALCLGRTIKCKSTYFLR